MIGPKTEAERFNADCRRYGRPAAVRRRRQRQTGYDARSLATFSRDVDRQFRACAAKRPAMKTAVSGWRVGG